MRLVTVALFPPSNSGSALPPPTLNDGKSLPPSVIAVLVCRPVTNQLSRVVVIESEDHDGEALDLRGLATGSVGAPAVVSFTGSLAKKGHLGTMVEMCAFELFSAEFEERAVELLEAALKPSDATQTVCMGSNTARLPQAGDNWWTALTAGRTLLWTVCTHTRGRHAYSPLESGIEAAKPVARLATPVIKAQVECFGLGVLGTYRSAGLLTDVKLEA